MTSQSVVRLAGPSDHQEIWRLFLGAHNENGLFHLAPEKVEWLIQRSLNPSLIQEGDTGTRGIIGVIGPVGALEAIVFLIIAQFWYTDDHHLEELLVFTDPEHRRSRHAEVMLQWMKDQVIKTDLPLFSGIMTNIRTEAKSRLYTRTLPKVGSLFFLRPNGANGSGEPVTALSS